MKRRMINTIILCAAVAVSTAQTPVLEQDVAADTLVPTNGPNYKNYTHWHINYGFIVGESEGSGAAIMQGNSYDFQLGIRYKRKICELYALGFQVNYDLQSFRIAQDVGKTFITAVLYDKQKFVYNNLEAEIYQRFSFGKRGNYMGKFIDMGGYGAWGFSTYHFTLERDVTGNGNAQITETTYKKLPYVNAVNYGLSARIGINKIAIYGKYRFSDLFRTTNINGTPILYPELPRIVVGIEIGIVG